VICWSFRNWNDQRMQMQTLDSAAVKDLLDRLQRIRPETRAIWGRMNTHQMVCHLRDSFDLAMGDKTASEDVNFFNRTLIKWVALYAPGNPRVHSHAPKFCN